jgi:alpha-1,6-mannosyltransferase
MIFVDINTFFAPKSGGIRVYHEAKLAWFAAHPEHRYFLVCPGPRYGERWLAENVVIVEVAGARCGRDPAGYRLMLDFARVLRLLRRVRPDVVEVGDPWMSGPFCLLLRSLGLLPGRLVSFYHCDAVPTWITPWASAPGRLQRLRAPAGRLATAIFYRTQRAYPLTAVASTTMQRRLVEQGIENVVRLPFGTDEAFFAAAELRRERREGGNVRLLYVGRLGREKGADLLLAALPRLLALPGVQLTVVGRGTYAADFAAIHHPAFAYRDFVTDRDELARIYGAHDVLLAPGAHETFGLSVLEALAAGLIVVGPDAGATADLLATLAPRFRFRAGCVDDFCRAANAAVCADLPAEAARSTTLARTYGSWSAAIERMVRYHEAATPAATAPAGRRPDRHVAA